MPNQTYIELAIREFKRMKALADASFAQVTAEQFFTAPSEADNSMVIIVKHVAGNLHSRWTDFLTSDGEKPNRDRDAEFEIMDGDTQQTLIDRWEQGWSALFSALEPLTDPDLERKVIIRGEPLTVLEAINRQLTHYSYHIGQVVYLGKHHAGSSWQSLSIPKGKSAQFNANPEKYVDRA